MKQEIKLMEMITYLGEELQVVELELLTGEDEVMYHCLNRHGEVTQLCAWEIELDRKEVSENV